MGEYSKTLRRLRVLNKEWPKGVMLFASSGSLMLVDARDHRVIQVFYGIECDGGDPGSFTADDNREYLSIC